MAEADLAEGEAELRDAERTLELAKAELEAAQAQADLRQRALDRQRDLSDRGVGTAALVETAELAARAADQAVVSRRQALSQAEAAVDRRSHRPAAAAASTWPRRERRLAETEIEAEFDGVLAESRRSRAVSSAPTSSWRCWSTPTRWRSRSACRPRSTARLLDADGRLMPAEVEVSLDVLGLDLTATGRISRGSATVGEGQTGRLVYAPLGEASGFRPGDFVTVSHR